MMAEDRGARIVHRLLSPHSSREQFERILVSHGAHGLVPVRAPLASGRVFRRYLHRSREILLGLGRHNESPGHQPCSAAAWRAGWCRSASPRAQRRNRLRRAAHADLNLKGDVI